MNKTILQIDSSGSIHNARSRQLTDRLVKRLLSLNTQTHLIHRDLAIPPFIPFVDEQWIHSNNTPQKLRSPEDLAVLALSDSLVAELQLADILVIGTPIYNFSIPAALKAWIDMVCRARLTFSYSESGAVGLLKNKKAYIIITSSGTKVGSSEDFVSPYLRSILGFMGITNVEYIAADCLMWDGDKKIIQAESRIDHI